MASVESGLGQGSGGARLRAWRTKAGLSLAKLAELSGLSKTYLLRLENDESSNPSLEVLRRIADALDITVADIVGGPITTQDVTKTVAPPSLQAFADEVGLPPREFQMLASIRWRKGEEPQTSERWRFVLNSLNASKHLDDDASR